MIAQKSFFTVLLLASTSFSLMAGVGETTPKASGKPEEAKTTVTLESGYTGEIDFEHDGKEVGSASVARIGFEIAQPLPPLPGGFFPKNGLKL